MSAIPETCAPLSLGLPGWVSSLLAAGLVLAASTNCGSDTELGPAEAVDLQSQKITPAGQTYTIADFAAIGFRESKQYSVDELAKAIDARYGFWKLEGIGVKEFELRFYASHEDAVQAGVAPADDATGEDANLDRATALWKEGHKDRRAIYDFRAAPMAKYKDYAIFGNVVVLCEGLTPPDSLAQCGALINALVGSKRHR